MCESIINSRLRQNYGALLLTMIISLRRVETSTVRVIILVAIKAQRILPTVLRSRLVLV